MGLTTLRHQADVLLPAGRRATVAVIDTGAEVSHPLLAGRVSARSYDFADNTANVTDVNGHGTATAGLIADLTPDEVDVMVLRVYGDDNLSKPSRVLTALEYALENGATVVNMSIGWPNAIEKGYSFLNSVRRATSARAAPPRTRTMSILPIRRWCSRSRPWIAAGRLTIPIRPPARRSICARRARASRSRRSPVA